MWKTNGFPKNFGGFSIYVGEGNPNMHGDPIWLGIWGYFSIILYNFDITIWSSGKHSQFAIENCQRNSWITHTKKNVIFHRCLYVYQIVYPFIDCIFHDINRHKPSIHWGYHQLTIRQPLKNGDWTHPPSQLSPMVIKMESGLKSQVFERRFQTEGHLQIGDLPWNWPLPGSMIKDNLE